MKRCNFCAEEIQDFAIKCRYCSSLLVKLPRDSNAEAGNPKNESDGGLVTYVLDKDLIRFTKFSVSVLTIFVLVGAFLYGIDLKQAAKEIKQSQDEVEKVNKELQEAKGVAKRLNEEAAVLLSEAKAQVAQISRSSDEARGIVSALPKYTLDMDLLRSQMLALLSPVLETEQLSKLKAQKAARSRLLLSNEDAKSLIRADIARYRDYFSARGLMPPEVPSEIYRDPNFMNAFWDGTKLIYGMGMANSDTFGPYESGIVIHEAVHSLFNIRYEGQSGAISEHICDVMSVVIRGGDWTIGSVRSSVPGKSQFLRSLSAPGTAYDTPLLGKDPQVGHMRDFDAGPEDGGNIHKNNGILNKAAYLMSEGGEFSNIKVLNGIGREKLGKLYSRVISKLSSRPEWTFRQFRDLVYRTADDESFDKNSIEAIHRAYAAVGL